MAPFSRKYAMDIRKSLTLVETVLAELSPFRSPQYQQYKDLMDPLKGKIGVAGRRMVLSQFLSFIEEQGWTPISHGTFGATFTRPDLDYVIKVFKNDPAYLAFVRYALAHQSNPCLPRFRGKFIRIDEDHFLVRMETLQPLDTEADYARVQLIGYAASRAWDSVQSFYSRAYAQIMNGKMAQVASDKSYLCGILKGLVKDTNILPTIFGLNQLGAAHKFGMDIANSNFMKRQDGTMVITDPFADTSIVDP